MNILGIAGYSGNGKTTLVGRLIPALKARGLTVSTVKHAHRRFDIDRPGKDSWVHREAGAQEVLVASARRWALIHELRDAPEPALETLLARLSPVDLVLVEGWKHGDFPKLEVHRPALGTPLLARSDPRVMAVAGDAPIADLSIPLLPLNDAAAIADFICTRLETQTSHAPRSDGAGTA